MVAKSHHASLDIRPLKRTKAVVIPFNLKNYVLDSHPNEITNRCPDAETENNSHIKTKMFTANSLYFESTSILADLIE